MDVRLRRTHADGRSMRTSTQKIFKLEPTDVILSSSHAKKLAFFWTRILSLDGIKSGKFSSIYISNININLLILKF